MKKILSSVIVLFVAISFSETPLYGQNMDDGSAILVVYRDGFLYGAWKDFDVKIDGEKVGELNKNKSIQTFQLSAGKHRVAPAKDSKGIDINMGRGTTNVIEYKVRFGLLGAVPKLDIKAVTEAEDDSELVREALMKEEN